MKTLAIETSCDDTSLAIISYEGDTFDVDQLLAYSQIADHQKYGGVLPEIASRLHSEKIIAILQNIGRDNIEEIDFISVTTHPGLPGSLVVGKAVATTLAEYFQKPLIEVDHIHGHIFSILLERKLTDITFPMVILTASGGHNDIYLVLPPDRGTAPKGRGVIKLAYSLDDASGEAFDKVSKMLWWPYPGGPRISKQAELWKPNPNYQFKRIFLPQDAEGRYPFSFSWMKSQVSFLLNKIAPLMKGGQGGSNTLTDQDIADIAYEFQEATIETLANRLLKIAKEQNAKTIAIAGWVSANNRLIEYLTQKIEQLNKAALPPDRGVGEAGGVAFFYPTKKIYSTDNWAMIGVAGILQYHS